MAAAQALAAMACDLRRKTLAGNSHLYKIRGRGGSGKSLGRADETLAARFEAYHARKAPTQAQVTALRPALAESAAL